MASRSLPFLGLALVASLLAGCIGSPDDTGNDRLAPQAASDPAPSLPLSRALRCADPCGGAIESGSGTASEPTVAVHPGNPRHVVAASQAYEEDALGNRVFWLHAHASFDGGLTWESARLPGGPGAEPSHPLAAYTLAGDPIVVILHDGTVLYGGLVSRGLIHGSPAIPAGYAFADLSVFVARSTDGGLTYPEVTVVASGIGAIGGLATAAGGTGFFTPFDGHDKPFIAASEDGTAILTWTNFQFPTVHDPARLFAADILFSLSKDGGKSWSQPAPVARGAFQGSYPALAPDGTLRVAFLGLPPPDQPYAQVPVDLVLATSNDQGVTWAAETIGTAINMNFPTLRAAGPAEAMHLHVAFAAPSDGGDPVPALLVSEDGGAMWSEPVLLDRPATGAKPLPTVGVDRRGVAYVGYYFPADGDGLEFRVAALIDDSVVPPLRVSQGVEAPGFAQRDYAGVAAFDEGAIAVWVGGQAPATDIHAARLS